MGIASEQRSVSIIIADQGAMSVPSGRQCIGRFALIAASLAKCLSGRLVIGRCIAVIASAVSVTAGPPGNHKTLCFSTVIVSAGLVRRSRTLSPETAVRPRRHAGFRLVPARGVRT